MPSYLNVWVEQWRPARHLGLVDSGGTEPFYPRLKRNSAVLVEYWVEQCRSIRHLVGPAPFHPTLVYNDAGPLDIGAQGP